MFRLAAIAAVRTATSSPSSMLFFTADAGAGAAATGTGAGAGGFCAVFASFSCYWESLFSLPVCALMMLAALILILRHTQRDENVI